MSVIDSFYNDRVVIGGAIIRDYESHFSRVAPRGASALVIGDKNGQNYETAYSVIARFYKPEQIDSKNLTVNCVKRIKISSEIRLIISVGDNDALSVGKFLSHKYGIKHIFIALSPCGIEYLTRYATLYCGDGYREIYSALVPDLVICDEELICGGDAIADAYGQVCARLVSLLDADFRLATENEKLRADYGNLLQTITDLIKEKEINKSKIIKYSLATSTALSGLDWTGDCSTQFAYAIYLYNKKRGKSESLAKIDGLCASVVASVYECALRSAIRNGVFAPDNNGYFVALVSMLGINPFRARKILTKIESYASVREKLYKLSLYRRQMQTRAQVFGKTLVFTALKQKRLYKDKGFSYNEYIGWKQAKAILPLICEMKGRSTLFNLLKQTGYLRPNN